MEKSENEGGGRQKRKETLDDILIARLLMAGVALAVTLLSIYVCHWLFVSLLGLGRLKAAVAIPILIAWGLTSLVLPSLPSRTAIVDGSARVDRAMFNRYLRREIATLVVALGLGVSSVSFGAPLPTRSQIESVSTGESGTTLTFRRELAGPPPFLDGLTISLAIVAFGTAIGSIRGAHKAWQIRTAVRDQGDT